MITYALCALVSAFFVLLFTALLETEQYDLRKELMKQMHEWDYRRINKMRRIILFLWALVAISLVSFVYSLIGVVVEFGA